MRKENLVEFLSAIVEEDAIIWYNTVLKITTSLSKILIIMILLIIKWMARR